VVLIAAHHWEPSLETALNYKNKAKRALAIGMLVVLLPIGICWGGGGEYYGRPYGWRWGIDPTPIRRPQPSLLGTTGFFDLPTSESLRQGNFAIGLFGTFEQVFKAHFNEGNNLTTLALQRYGLTLSGAYGILDNLELGVAIPGASTDAEIKQTKRPRKSKITRA
jgi:hypothetical protein